MCIVDTMYIAFCTLKLSIYCRIPFTFKTHEVYLTTQKFIHSDKISLSIRRQCYTPTEKTIEKLMSQTPTQYKFN